MSKSLRNAIENPCHMCMPMGAIFPFKGCEQAMVVIHGSQGCATYMRRHISEHFNEPVDVASSSVTENSAIYGAGGNLQKALDNVIRLYSPSMVGVISTCLAETIGEDLKQLVDEYRLHSNYQHVPIVTVNTPGYGGSHHYGYWAAATAIISSLAAPCAPHQRINVIMPNISPADIREIRRMLQLMEMQYVLFPDISDTLDSPYMHSYKKLPPGGTALKNLREMSGAPATIQIGCYGGKRQSPGAFLQETFGVPLYDLPLPVGLANTDRFCGLLTELSRQHLHRNLIEERGRLLDGMVDAHKYNFGARAAILGDPHQVAAVASLCHENGLQTPVLGSVVNKPEADQLAEVIGQSPGAPARIMSECDFAEIKACCVKEDVQLAVGSSDARYLSEQAGIPLVRHGYPIHDRVGGQRLLAVGYAGSMLLLDRLTNTLLEQKQSHYRASIKEQYWTPFAHACEA